jgi:hypothetical protein
MAAKMAAIMENFQEIFFKLYFYCKFWILTNGISPLTLF